MLKNVVLILLLLLQRCWCYSLNLFFFCGKLLLDLGKVPYIRWRLVQSRPWFQASGCDWRERRYGGRNLRDMQKPCAPSPKSRTCCVLETTSPLMLSTVTNLFHHVDGDASGWTYRAGLTNKVKPPFQNTRFRTFCFLYEGRVSKSSTMID